jgi:hypothetical protein
MDRRIVDAIVGALSQGDDDNLVFVKERVGNHSYRLKVTVKMGFCHKLTSIERIGVEIGKFYDNVLHVDKMRHVIIFSEGRK